MPADDPQTPDTASPVSWRYIDRMEKDIREIRKDGTDARDALMARMEGQAQLWNEALQRSETDLAERVETLEGQLTDLKHRSEAVLEHYATRREDTRQLVNDAVKGVIILIIGGVFSTYVLPILQHLATTGHHP